MEKSTVDISGANFFCKLCDISVIEATISWNHISERIYFGTWLWFHHFLLR